MSKTNADIAHYFFHSDDRDQSNQRGTFYFKNDTIYSYGEHFPIARIVNENTLLFTTRTYSVSTGKQVLLVRKAVPLDMEVIYMSDVCAYTNSYLINPERILTKKYQRSVYLEEIGMLVDLEKKLAKTRDGSGVQHQVFGEINTIIDNCNKYSKLFKLGFRAKTIRLLDDALMVELKKKHGKSLLKDRKKRALELKKNKVKNADKLARWIQGESYHMNLIGDNTVHCRVKDGNVETSMNARFETKFAKMVWQQITKCRDNNESWKSNGHTIELGMYQVNSISNNGTLVAGCHKVFYEQMLPVATELGLIKKQGETK